MALLKWPANKYGPEHTLRIQFDKHSVMLVVGRFLTNGYEAYLKMYTLSLIPILVLRHYHWAGICDIK